jgi:hypothetical protein
MNRYKDAKDVEQKVYNLRCETPRPSVADDLFRDWSGCPCRKSDPDVLVVETAENRPRKNPANGMNYT